MNLVENARRVPVVLWFAGAVVVCLAVLVWHRFALDDEDTDWLDPGQPPLNVDLDMHASAPAVLPRFRAVKPYPYNSLTGHPGCWVGDC